MIHHFARALFVRSAMAAQASEAQPPAARPSSGQPVRPRPITPWTVPANQGARATPPQKAPGTHAGAKVVAFPAASAGGRVRISSDPSDARRTVISGRFAEVCAALDRLVREQEAAA